MRRIERKRRREVGDRLARVPTVSVFVDTGFLNTVPDQSLIGDVLRRGARQERRRRRSRAGPVDLADLARLDPDVYLATSDAEVTLTDLRRNPATRKLRAVRERTVRDRSTRTLLVSPARASETD